MDGTVTISVDASPTMLAASDEVVSYPPDEDRVLQAEDASMAAAEVILRSCFCRVSMYSTYLFPALSLLGFRKSAAKLLF
jgi:hypothetical protein